MGIRAVQEESKETSPSVLDYMNYREYLKDHYDVQKEERTGFTYAKFASAAGLKSPNYYKLVMDGEKNLTVDNVVRFAKALGFGDIETDYFETLVYFNQAKNRVEKDHYLGRLKRIRVRAQSSSGQIKTLEEYEFEMISNWISHAILVLAHVPGFRESPRWISERFKGLVSIDEASTILQRLIEMGLLARDKDNKLEPTFKQLHTKSELKRESARLFYEGLLKRAINDFSISAPETRECSAFMVGISQSQIPELRKKVREFMQSLNEWALENSTPSQVYAMNFMGFQMTEPDPRMCQ